MTIISFNTSTIICIQKQMAFSYFFFSISPIIIYFVLCVAIEQWEKKAARRCTQFNDLRSLSEIYFQLHTKKKHRQIVFITKMEISFNYKSINNKNIQWAKLMHFRRIDTTPYVLICFWGSSISITVKMWEKPVMESLVVEI